MYTNGSMATSSMASNSSRASTTADICGRDFGLTLRHWYAIAAAFWTARREYCPSRLLSMARSSRREESCNKYGCAHSMRLCSRGGRFLSTTFRPVRSSNNTTPKLYTSLFVVRWPSKKTCLQKLCTLLVLKLVLYES
jgi:hypothetical protein